MRKTDRDRLEENIKNKIQTTMIGAIAAIERNFNTLLDNVKYRDIFDQARKEILDLGNKQIRNATSEIRNYDVSWNKFSIVLTPIRKECNEQN